MEKRFDFSEQFEEPQEIDQKVHQDNLVTIGEQARKCLNSGEFTHYKGLFEAELASIMNAMVVYTANFGKQGNENLEMYAVNMIRYVQRITDLRKLLSAVEIDSKKNIKEVKHDEKQS